MKRKVKIAAFTFLSTLALAALGGEQAPANSERTYHSQYRGQEQRRIKSLSTEDIEELSAGKGWGLAKAAELNGVPGPVHLLQMADEIRLTPTQREQIEGIYAEMKARAIPLGEQLIALERDLNAAFAGGTITDETLQALLAKIADVYRKLRYVHLSAHLQTPDLLTSEQIRLYTTLRGYSSDDPCQSIPPGHDVEMWKRHNNCP